MNRTLCTLQLVPSNSILKYNSSHPSLAELPKKHLAVRGYRSGYLFRHGRDTDTRTGLHSNRQNAWRICKRVQRAARLDESVHPHRFRKTLATLGRKLGMDPQYLQAILGQELSP